MKIHLSLIVITSMLLVAASVCHAQGTSGSGLFGDRTLGGGVSSNRSGALSGTPGTNLEQLQQGVGEISGNERFIRDSRQPGAFVGADTSEVQNARSAGGGGQGLGGLQNLFNQFQQQPNQGQGNNTTQRKPIRVPIKLGFQHTPLSGSRVSANMMRLFARIPQLGSSDGIKVSMVGRVAILHGSVNSESERGLAGRLALLEPGISAVENQLRVEPANSNASTDVLPELNLPIP